MLPFTSLHIVIATGLGNSRPLHTRATWPSRAPWFRQTTSALWVFMLSYCSRLESNPLTIQEMKKKNKKNYISGELKLKYWLLCNLCVSTEQSYYFITSPKSSSWLCSPHTLHAVFLSHARIKCSTLPSTSLKDTPENKHTVAWLCLLILFFLSEWNHILSILHKCYLICKPLWDFHLINLDTFFSWWY